MKILLLKKSNRTEYDIYINICKYLSLKDICRWIQHPISKFYDYFIQQYFFDKVSFFPEVYVNQLCSHTISVIQKAGKYSDKSDNKKNIIYNNIEIDSFTIEKYKEYKANTS